MKFYEAIEQELQKVETFYCAREDEMRERVNVLKVQMRELGEHRKIFHVCSFFSSMGIFIF